MNVCEKVREFLGWPPFVQHACVDLYLKLLPKEQKPAASKASKAGHPWSVEDVSELEEAIRNTRNGGYLDDKATAKFAAKFGRTEKAIHVQANIIRKRILGA